MTFFSKLLKIRKIHLLVRFDPKFPVPIKKPGAVLMYLLHKPWTLKAPNSTVTNSSHKHLDIAFLQCLLQLIYEDLLNCHHILANFWAPWSILQLFWNINVPMFLKILSKSQTIAVSKNIRTALIKPMGWTNPIATTKIRKR